MPYEQKPDYFLCDTPTEAFFTEEMILDGATTLQRNAEKYLHPRTVDQQVTLVENLAQLWLDEAYPIRRELLDHCEKDIHFSREVLAQGLTEVFHALSRERIYHLLKIELGHEKALDGWFKHLQSDEAPSHSSHHFSFRLVGALYQQSVPTQLILFMVKCLLAKTSQWIICGPETLEVARLFAHSIYQLDSKAAACIEVADCRRMEPHLNVFKKQCQYYRSWSYNARQLLQRKGHLGFVWVSQDYITQNGTARLIQRLAKDVTAWDQLYPNAPHVVFVQQTSGNNAEKLAEQLMNALSALDSKYPQKHFELAHAAQLHAFRKAYKLRAKMNADTLVFDTGTETSPGCSVIYEMEPRFSPSTGNRFIYVRPVQNLETLLSILESHRGQIGCVGLAVTAEESALTARRLALWGIPHICAAGMMHLPCLYREGDMTSLDELTYKSFWEKAYYDA